ncbi:hypothetical protein PVK06_046975 [Gossypium arboreum]|uniref:Uncharacterized protein n=1 Tax=Gossypium arboreum TaxID=29729 RepID=A0ABR0MCI6_GOSAR|nr:hypothetical protein PVK06_046975 [Gossypium arboreum]
MSKTGCPTYTRVDTWNIESISNPNPEPEYESSEETSQTSYSNPPLSEDIFGDNPEPQHSTYFRSSLYHLELHRQAPTPNIEDIFGSAHPVSQYPFTPNDRVYNYTTSLSALGGTPEAGPSNYQMPPQVACPRQWRQPNRYTLASGMSLGYRQF